MRMGRLNAFAAKLIKFFSVEEHIESGTAQVTLRASNGINEADVVGTLYVGIPAKVGLLRFVGERTGSGVQLSWQTGAELDCATFTLLPLPRKRSELSRLWLRL